MQAIQRNKERERENERKWIIHSKGLTSDRKWNVMWWEREDYSLSFFLTNNVFTSHVLSFCLLFSLYFFCWSSHGYYTILRMNDYKGLVNVNEVFTFQYLSFVQADYMTMHTKSSGNGWWSDELLLIFVVRCWQKNGTHLIECNNVETCCYVKNDSLDAGNQNLLFAQWCGGWAWSRGR